MAISCDPADLSAAAKCFACLTPEQREAVKTYLLAVIAGGSLDPSVLMADAKCFVCVQEDHQRAIQNYLLCQILGSGGTGTCVMLSGAGDPTGVTTPDFSGQLYHDTTNDVYYYSTGTTSADWTLIPSGGACIYTTVPGGDEENIGINIEGVTGGVTELTWNGTAILNSMYFKYDTTIQTVSFPNLTSIDPTAINSATLDFNECSAIQSISFPALDSSGYRISFYKIHQVTTFSFPLLTSVSGLLSITVCNGCTSISCPSLTSIGLVTITDNPALLTIDFSSVVTAGYIDCEWNSSLTSIVLTNWVPTSGSTYLFNNNAFTDVCVNAILARCVANAGFVAGTVNLTGATNAAPSGQGILDKATLIGRGVNVTTN